MQSNGISLEIPEPTCSSHHRAGQRYRGCASILRWTFMLKTWEKGGI